MHASSVEVDLEFGTLSFQVRDVPGEEMVEVLPAWCADEAFHERMEEGHVR